MEIRIIREKGINYAFINSIRARRRFVFTRAIARERINTIMRERDIEKILKRGVEWRLQGICFKFVSPGNAGVPDRIVLLPPLPGQTGGRIIFVELKADDGGVLSPRQKVQIDRIKKLGFDVRVLIGIDQVRDFIDEMKGGDAL